jgi:hypothetical protein
MFIFLVKEEQFGDTKKEVFGSSGDDGVNNAQADNTQLEMYQTRVSINLNMQLHTS